MQNRLMRIEGLSKKFGPTVALDKICLDIKKGEIHGFIGENGSGKSTASAIMCGMLQADSGKMFYREQIWKPHNMLDAQRNGVGMIVQEAGTIPTLTVAENIFLGLESDFSSGPFVNRNAMYRAAAQALSRIGIEDIPPGIRTFELDMQKRKLIEIARVMSTNPELLIIDETTTTLSYTGRLLLYDIMRKMASEGKAVLIISHDMDEIIEHCNKITVLRDGKIITSYQKEEFDPKKIRESMIGREISGDYYRTDNEGYGESVVLRAKDVTTMQNVEHVSFDLHEGEILGIGGLSECGMHDLGKALYGEVEVIEGEVVYEKANRTVTNTVVAKKLGMAYISKNRDTESLALNAPIYDNIASTGYRENSVVQPFLSLKKEKEYVNGPVRALSIKCRDIYQSPQEISGGNKQKVAFGKWVASNADVLIMDCPTRGVDIGVKAEMYHLMASMKREGKSIIMISEELNELIGMSDRVLIMRDGKIVGEYSRSEGLSESQLIETMI